MKKGALPGRSAPAGALLLALCGPPAASAAPDGAETDLQVNGYLRMRPAYRVVREDTPNNPGSLVFQTSERQAQSFALLRADVSRDPARLHLQLRPVCELEEHRDGCAGHLDEGYLDVAAAPSLFLFGGRRNLVSGIAHLTNPTDFLGQDQEMDLRG